MNGGCGGHASVGTIRRRPKHAMDSVVLVRHLRLLTGFLSRSACQAYLLSQTPNGSCFVRFSPHRNRRQADQPPTIAWSSRECCGSCVLAHPGASCQNALDRGLPWLVAINAGVKWGSGHTSYRPCRRMRFPVLRLLEPVTVTVVLSKAGKNTFVAKSTLLC